MLAVTINFINADQTEDQTEDSTLTLTRFSIVKEISAKLPLKVGEYYENAKVIIASADDICAALGYNEDTLSANIEKVFLTQKVVADKTTGKVSFTDTLLVSRFGTDGWFGRYSETDAETGEENVLTQNGPMTWGAGGSSTFYVQNPTIANGKFSITYGQYPGTLAIGDADYAVLYLVNGTKAVKITLTVDVREHHILTIQAGEYADFSIDLKTQAPQGTGYQADFYLPEGLSIPKDSDGNYMITQPNGEGKHTLMSSLQPDSAIRVMLFSVDNTTFAESDGSVVDMTFYADLNMVPGDYKVWSKNRVVSTQDPTQTIELPDTEYTVEVTAPIYYNLVYVADGDTIAKASYPRETPITIMEDQTKEGYTFSGWSGFPEDGKMPAEDVIVTGSFSVNYYKLAYLVDGAEYKSDYVAFGTVITPEAEPTKEGYTFSGWSGLPTDSIMPANDVTVTGTFAVNYYKLTYVVDGIEVSSDSISFGTAITPEAEPTKEGFTFSGWSGLPTDSIMPANDVTVTGSFAVNYYKLTYVVDGVENKSDSVAYGTAITPEAEPTKEGYTFSGWSGFPEDGKMPANDVTVTGSFSVNYYLLTYKVNDEVYKEDSVAFGTTITPEPAPVEVGYKFSGWSEIPETMPAHDVVVTGTLSHDVFLLSYYIDDNLFTSDSVIANSVFVPTVAPDKKGRTFSGWTGLPEGNIMPANDLSIYGSYSVIDSVVVALDQELTTKDIEDISKLRNVVTLDLSEITTKAIPANAFCGIETLKEVRIPDVVESVGDNILSNCPNLLEVIWNTTATIPATAFRGSNADGNLFIFAPAGTEAYCTNGNVVIGGNIQDVEFKDAKPLQISQQFTAGKVSYSREFSKQSYIHEASGWEAMVLPFDVQEVTYDRGNLSPFHTSTADKHFWLAGLAPNGFGYAVSMQANVPYIISMPNSEEYDPTYNISGRVTFSANGTTVHPTSDAQTFSGNDLTFRPSYCGEAQSESFYVINDESSYGYHPGGIFVRNERAVRPFEAYITVSQNSSDARPYIVIGGEEATGIKSLNRSGECTESTQPSTLTPIIYDLSGRRINQMEKGMNLVNGKKMLK